MLLPSQAMKIGVWRFAYDLSRKRAYSRPERLFLLTDLIIMRRITALCISVAVFLTEDCSLGGVEIIAASSH